MALANKGGRSARRQQRFQVRRRGDLQGDRDDASDEGRQREEMKRRVCGVRGRSAEG